MDDDLTTPPDQPLDDAARARLRGRVLAGLAEPAASGSGRRWAAPAAAAAAVVVLAGATGWATLAPGAEDVAPADRGTSSPEVLPTPTPADDVAVPDPSDGSDRPDDPTGQGGVTPHEGPAVEPTPSGAGPAGGPAVACRRDLDDVLPGAVPALTLGGTLGATSFLVGGDRFVLCDTAGGTVTLHGAQPLDGRHAPDDTTPWRVSTNAVDPQDGTGGLDLVLVAGGIVPPRAEGWGISYTFPDGHVEEATTGTDAEGRTWWRMEHVATDGVLVARGTDQTTLEPILVDVRVAGTSTEHELRWGEDTCAQVNHGC
ncbi:hypothetical protein FE634_08835 [Nocardioides dongxiaopingii]|uniref:hypothetical protein n=1 Tax=Nocardioides TaxID=1839 RepID=UPI0010C76FBA|nr:MULTISPECIES: hypothetical protein [Nocardioides]QCW50489.2 hypothetical protein FE634_08835 [Nocardioides sp. S-1144]